jgi:tetratricopeptide (TPR) repeat protein
VRGLAPSPKAASKPLSTNSAPPHCVRVLPNWAMLREVIARLRPRPAWGLVVLFGLSGCAGELTAFAALAFSMTLGAWIIGRDRQRRALYEAETLRHAIASGQHRGLEDRLRRELALADAGEAVSLERQWLARAQLGGLMVAEWRLDEAREIYGTEHTQKLSPHLAALAAFGRHELAVLTETPDEARLEAIRRDRDACLQHVPAAFRRDVEHAWNAVEGLCLVRMGRAREATPLIENGLGSLEYNPALVVYLFHLGQAYEHIGERKLAAQRYEEAMKSFPGTRLASEAKARQMALGPGTADSMFRGMLPEAPGTAQSTALATAASTDDDASRR